MEVVVVGSGLVGLAVAWLAVTYNRLVSRRNRAQEAWSGIDVQLKRRADLVPNLVAVVSGYRVHEQQVLEAVTAARTRMIAAAGPAESGRADDALEGALQQLFAVAEAYPELRASDNFLSLQRELAALEEDISFARRYYNALVERLNTAVQRFPTVLVAGLLGFTPLEFFKAEEPARAVPAADLGL